MGGLVGRLEVPRVMHAARMLWGWLAGEVCERWLRLIVSRIEWAQAHQSFFMAKLFVCTAKKTNDTDPPPCTVRVLFWGGIFSFFLLLPLTDPDPKMIPKKKEEFSFCAVFSGALV